MPAVARNPCINDPSDTYSSKESSPKGNGYSAKAEDEGTIMLGKDGTNWVVAIDRNRNKVWARVPTQLNKEEPNITNVKPEPEARPIVDMNL